MEKPHGKKQMQVWAGVKPRSVLQAPQPGEGAVGQDPTGATRLPAPWFPPQQGSAWTSCKTWASLPPEHPAPHLPDGGFQSRCNHRGGNDGAESTWVPAHQFLPACMPGPRQCQPWAWSKVQTPAAFLMQGLTQISCQAITPHLERSVNRHPNQVLWAHREARAGLEGVFGAGEARVQGAQGHEQGTVSQVFT